MNSLRQKNIGIFRDEQYDISRTPSIEKEYPCCLVFMIHFLLPLKFLLSRTFGLSDRINEVNF